MHPMHGVGFATVTTDMNRVQIMCSSARMVASCAAQPAMPKVYMPTYFMHQHGLATLTHACLNCLRFNMPHERQVFLSGEIMAEALVFHSSQNF